VIENNFLSKDDAEKIIMDTLKISHQFFAHVFHFSFLVLRLSPHEGQHFSFDFADCFLLIKFDFALGFLQLGDFKFDRVRS
jgi:hypothetical protein